MLNKVNKLNINVVTQFHYYANVQNICKRERCINVSSCKKVEYKQNCIHALNRSRSLAHWMAVDAPSSPLPPPPSSSPSLPSPPPPPSCRVFCTVQITVT